MKINSLLAFLLTLIAVLMLIGLLGWISFSYLSRILNKDPKYCESFSIELKPEIYSSNLTIGQGKLIKVNLTNNGFEDEFKISFEGPEWVETRPFKIRLDQGKSEDIFVYISPLTGYEGSYEIKVLAKSYCGADFTIIKVEV